jgi:hypothetical protein
MIMMISLAACRKRASFQESLVGIATTHTCVRHARMHQQLEAETTQRLTPQSAQ